MHLSILSKIKNFPQSRRLRGKMLPLYLHPDILNIKKVIQFSKTHTKYPLLFIKTNQYYFIGVILAQFTSDFLLEMAKKHISSDLKTTRFHKFTAAHLKKWVVNFSFPGYSMGTQLVFLTRWQENQDFDLITATLREVQENFQIYMKKSIEKMLSST